jgi:glycerol-3-phosphate dehydrogenase (NAD(P)+)
MQIGVIGAGSFGVTVASLLALKNDVLLYTRSTEKQEAINSAHFSHGVQLSERIVASANIEEICQCRLIFPIVPSTSFRGMMKNFSPYLSPAHILIHGTKGLDVNGISDDELMSSFFHRDQVHTMSEIIRIESPVVRVGCLAGPNLSKEILQGQPAAAVIASEFDEVIKIGMEVLSSKKFFTFGSHDLKGTELAGAYKNIIALGTGMLTGLNMGKNMQSILINRGWHEMIKFGLTFGTTTSPFLGTAGIGDLIATCTSENSRNFTFGKRLARGETMEEIFNTTYEIVEGVRTLRIIRQLARNEELMLPITELLYKIVFEGLPFEKALDILMRQEGGEDVDFL